MWRSAALGVMLSFGVIVIHAQSTDPAVAIDEVQSVQQWRTARLARLTAPDGWLSLIGLDWLKRGDNRIGAAADNDIVLRAGPAHLGTLHWDEHDRLTMTLANGVDATIDGQRVDHAVLLDDAHVAEDATPTTVRFGTASFYVIDREGRKALRLKDSAASTRKSFLGIDYFPIDASWRISAQWIPFDPPHDLQMGSVIGTIDTVKVPGKAVFQRDGKTYELLPYQEEPGGELFFVLADRTSGRQTYGAARFLYAALPKDGEVILDFNAAYNPPCAFTAFATCPLAPPENRLDLRVTAGELKYRGEHP